MDHDKIDFQMHQAWDRGFNQGFKEGGGGPENLKQLNEDSALYRDFRQSMKMSFTLSDFWAVKKTLEAMGYDEV